MNALEIGEYRFRNACNVIGSAILFLLLPTQEQDIWIADRGGGRGSGPGVGAGRRDGDRGPDGGVRCAAAAGHGDVPGVREDGAAVPA